MATEENDLVVGPIVLADGVSLISLDFFFEADTDLQVFQTGSFLPLTLGADYTVTGAGTSEGSITLTTPANGVDQYAVFLVPTLERATDLQLRGQFQSDPFNVELDRIWRSLQALNTRINRAMLVSETSVPVQPLFAENALSRAGRVPVFSADGTALELGADVSDITGLSAAAAAAIAAAAAADADAAQTAADRIQTGIDAAAAAADRVQTGLDAAATGADAAQTAGDALATAADRVVTTADRVVTTADRVQTTADAIQTAADRVQTGLDRVQTGADRVQTGLDRTQTGIDAAAAAASALSADFLNFGLGRYGNPLQLTNLDDDTLATGFYATDASTLAGTFPPGWSAGAISNVIFHRRNGVGLGGMNGHMIYLSSGTASVTPRMYMRVLSGGNWLSWVEVSPSGWQTYDGSAVGTIYSHATSGNVAVVTSPVLENGYEYLFTLGSLSHNSGTSQTPVVNLEWDEGGTPVWANDKALMASSVSAAATLVGHVYVQRPREANANFSIEATVVIASGTSGAVVTGAPIYRTQNAGAVAGISGGSAVIRRVRFKFTGGDIDGGLIRMYKRRTG
jgi:hypothetical protein